MTPSDIYMTGPPNPWQVRESIASVVTAAATAVLAIGLIMTAYQIWLSRKFSRVTESNHLLREFDEKQLRRACFRLQQFDGIETYLETSRHRANKLYARAKRLRRFRRYKHLWESLSSIIQTMAQVTDRIESYLRSGTADESLIAENIGYHIIVSYYALQDILQERRLEEDYTYESYRDLAMRMQDYGKLYRRRAQLRKGLCWAGLPPFADTSERPKARPYLPWWAAIRKVRLWMPNLKYQMGTW
jgi:hypothetical protein